MSEVKVELQSIVIELHECPICGKKHTAPKKELSKEEIETRIKEIKEKGLEDIFCVCPKCGVKHFRKKR